MDTLQSRRRGTSSSIGAAGDRNRSSMNTDKQSKIDGDSRYVGSGRTGPKQNAVHQADQTRITKPHKQRHSHALNICKSFQGSYFCVIIMPLFCVFLLFCVDSRCLADQVWEISPRPSDSSRLFFVLKEISCNWLVHMVGLGGGMLTTSPCARRDGNNSLYFVLHYDAILFWSFMRQRMGNLHSVWFYYYYYLEGIAPSPESYFSSGQWGSFILFDSVVDELSRSVLLVYSTVCHWHRNDISW